ncbi:hypothetical protein JCM8097_001398 [Rhodosporidiobolus ruineniae]
MVTLRSQRVPLKSLTALTLHSSRKTAHRRLPPIPQLTCKGKACRQYQPDIVQCTKVGEDGVGGVEWKCEADLPRGVRFGGVQVGCEGWDGPDDPFILRGSCGLSYNLVRSSSALEAGYDSFTSRLPSSFRNSSSLFNSGFNLLFALLTLYLAFSLLLKLFRPLRRTLTRFFGGTTGGGPGNPPPPRGGGGGGGGPGWFSGGGRGSGPSPRPPGPPGPPPPYTPKPDSQPAQGEQGWRPGFWTGALAGWAANAFLGAGAGGRERREDVYERYGRAPQFQQGGGFWGGGPARGGGLGGFGSGLGGFGGRGWGGAAPRQRGWGVRDDSSDRGAGGSGSGGMRRSTGFGGTNVR